MAVSVSFLPPNEDTECGLQTRGQAAQVPSPLAP